MDDGWATFEADDAGIAVEKIIQTLQLDLKKHGIEAEKKSKKVKAGKLKSLITSLKKPLKAKYLASKHSAQAFVKLLGAIDQATKEDIIGLLKGPALDDVM